MHGLRDVAAAEGQAARRAAQRLVRYGGRLTSRHASLSGRRRGPGHSARARGGGARLGGRRRHRAAALDAGYKPVGRDFPVFLHPQTHEEYALARRERKTGPGYRGFVTEFSPDVTLEEDLRRRDLTINAMAQADGRRADRSATAARRDLAGARPAPCLRGLRRGPGAHPARGALCRSLRTLGFTVAPDTLDLMRQWWPTGEVDALVAERVWQETERALGEAAPGGVLPGATRLRRAGGDLSGSGPPVRRATAAGVAPGSGHWQRTCCCVWRGPRSFGASTAVRFAALAHDLGKALTPPEQWPRHHGHEGAGVRLWTSCAIA